MYSGKKNKSTGSKKLPTLRSIREAVVAPARVKAAYATGLLETPMVPMFDALAAEIRLRFHTPMVLITIVDQYKDYVMGHAGLPEPYASTRVNPDGPTFCQLTITQQEPVVISDTKSDSLFRMFPSVRDHGVRAHLGIPLFLNGKPIGNCCIIDTRPRDWTSDDIEGLEELAGEVMGVIERNISADKRRVFQSATEESAQA